MAFKWAYQMPSQNVKAALRHTCHKTYSRLEQHHVHVVKSQCLAANGCWPRSLQKEMCCIENALRPILGFEE